MKWAAFFFCHFVPTEADVKLVPCIWILDSQYGYGTEFCGSDAGIPLSPVTEKCFLSMTMALKQMMGTVMVGPPGSYKTETVKVNTFFCARPGG